MTIPAQQTAANVQTAASVTITAAENGPYEIAGPFSMCDHDGRVVAVPEGQAVRLCRCGASGDKPFCDGSEETVAFDGTLARLQALREPVIRLVRPDLAEELALRGIGVDDKQLDAEHGGELGEGLGAGRRGQDRVMRAAGRQP
jgi:CDGSH-type Zn-finger protein